MGRSRSRFVVALLALLLPATALGQEFFRGRNFREGRPGLPTANGVVDRGFTFCRLRYTSVREEPMGSGWRTDYPDGDANFMTRLSQLTTTRTAAWDDGSPGHAVVDALDPLLFQCPFLFTSDAGTAGFSPAEVEQLREYFLKGGFLWVDDFWGERAWAHWVSQIKNILPERTIQEVPMDHAMLSSLYIVRKIPQISNINFWARSGGATSERGAESATAHLRMIVDDEGDPLVLMTFNTDVADGWEREADNMDFFKQFSPESYGLAMNVAVWVMTH
jgi:hypothetical protein